MIELFAALACAAEITKRGSNAHVARGAKGFYASEYQPPRSERREWIRVRIDGKLECGETGTPLGKLSDFGLTAGAS